MRLPRRRQRQRQKTAFSLVELLISVALLAILLAAVAAAMHASFQSYSENDKVAAATQTARFLLGRMANEIRTAEDVQTTATRLDILPADDGSGLQLVQYEYLDGKLYYRQTVNGTTEGYILLDSDEDVTLAAFAATAETGTDWQGLSCTKSVTLRITFAVGGRTFSLSASADPRRNQLY